ncbi:copper homeostasis protein cutC [Vespula squamosa]|uniref:Copper homeostasis protein cutC homolog n=1 Tax=Vespula squamosa TaxID=30214 RepID=A0ABD2A7D6_VESSQ
MCKKVEGTPLSIMSNSSITPDNILDIKLKIGIDEFHATARKKRQITENERNRFRMGTAEEDYVMVTDINMEASRMGLEICVDTFESARNAILGGATRLELCSALSEGGLTPSVGFVARVRKLYTVYNYIQFYVMLRVRSGNFIYSREEMDIMLYDLKTIKDLKLADGFVFGALTKDREIDTLYCTEIILAAKPLPVTFHRAFDEIRQDPLETIQLLMSLGIRRILSSGREDTAEKGVNVLKMMHEHVKYPMSIMAGCGITPDNISYIKLKTGINEFHASARKKRQLTENERNRFRMGTAEEDSVMVTDVNTVRKMHKIIFPS